MPNTKSKSKNKFEKDYEEIMKNAELSPIISNNQKTWYNPNELFIKFSYYQEMPFSITSTDSNAL